jgi:nucleoside-diphosphate-sugar epimerase
VLGRVTVHKVDLADLAALAPAVQDAAPRVVVHAAARGGHPATAAERVASWHDTVVATAVLLEVLRGAGPERLVHLGSSLEYRPADHPLRETDPMEPVTARGAMKAAATVAVRQWAGETGTAATVVRPFSVYGPGEQAGRLVPTLVACLRDGTPFRLVAGTARRDFVHIDDVVDAVLLAARHPGAPGQTFNVGTGVETDTAEVVALAQEVTGRPLVLADEALPPRSADVAHWAADVSHTEVVLGWRSAIDLAEGLGRTFEASGS